MNQHLFKLNVFIFLILSLTRLHAQESVNAAGGNASGSGGSSSYSIGQLGYTTITGTNGSLAQGVQQPFEISVVTELDEATGISLIFSAYPNPTNNFLILKIDASTLFNNELFNYQLFDINGSLLETKKIESTETNINTINLVTSTYFVKIMRDNLEIKTFKIIKN